MIWLLPMLWPPQAQSDTALLITVHELLRMDAERARQNVSPRSCPGDAPLTSQGRSVDGGIELKAIYGRDKQLLAEVRLGERSLVYQQGQPWPIGRHRDRSMRLHSLSSRCIELQEGDQKHELCLEP
ncbi:hypothetical protein [Alcaligenes sp. Marseille-Q7550]